MRPPTDLNVVVTDAEGRTTRWASETTNPRNVPSGITFRTARMQGFADGSVILPRRTDHDNHDVRLLDGFTLIGADGSVAYDGRVDRLGKSSDHSLTVAAVGWVAELHRRKFTEVFVDRSLAAWKPMARGRRITVLTTPAKKIEDHDVSQDATSGLPALVTKLTEPYDNGANCEPLYDTGPGLKAASVYYDFAVGPQLDPANLNYTWTIAATDTDDGAGGSSTAELRAASGSGYYTPTTPRRYLSIRFARTTTSPGDNLTVDLYWRKLAVYGNHGLPLIGDAPAGVAASDVLKYVVARYAPKLNTSMVQQTTYPITHLVFDQRTTPYDAILRVNAPHLWDLAVWEKQTVHYGPVDVSSWDWEIRTDDPGVTISEDGDSAQELANGVVVNFTNVATGAQDTVTPDDIVDLRDLSTDNPFNRHGDQAWLEYNLSWPATRELAIEIGRVALIEHNAPKSPGQITVQNHVRDRQGNWQPVWKVRAGDRVIVASDPGTRVRVVQETSYSHDSRQLTMSVDRTAVRLEAVNDRVQTALAAANLT